MQHKQMADLLEPKDAINPILSDAARNGVSEWIIEVQSSAELADAGLKPRRSVLLYGPPGVGKTTLAHYMAARIGLPLAIVRPDMLVDAFIGSTGRNIGTLFRWAVEQGPVILFFDEFEALGSKRLSADSAAAREMNASVDVLLQCIERHDGLIAAATNMRDQLDPAIWRRFDLQMNIGMPMQSERRRIQRRYLKPWGMPRAALEALATATDGASPALLRNFCEGLKRSMVLGPKLGWDMALSSVVARIIVALEPPPGVGLPRLWSKAGDDPALGFVPWPLPRFDEIVEDEAPDGPPDENVITPFRKRG